MIPQNAFSLHIFPSTRLTTRHLEWYLILVLLHMQNGGDSSWESLFLNRTLLNGEHCAIICTTGTVPIRTALQAGSRSTRSRIKVWWYPTNYRHTLNECKLQLDVCRMKARDPLSQKSFPPAGKWNFNPCINNIPIFELQITSACISCLTI